MKVCSIKWLVFEKEHIESDKQGKDQLSVLKPLQHLDGMDIVGKECPIYYCNFEEEMHVFETVCRHCFHKECVVPGLFRTLLAKCGENTFSHADIFFLKYKAF